MKRSNFFLPTIKENPAEAKITSHRLMLRSGMIRQSSSGIYSWLPLGLRVLKNIEKIIRIGQDNIAQEILMPTIQDAVLGFIGTDFRDEEINDALTRFLKKGGEIQKVEYKDNGFLLKNDLALDDNYAEATDSVISQLNVDFEPENRIWFKAFPLTK